MKRRSIDLLVVGILAVVTACLAVLLTIDMQHTNFVAIRLIALPLVLVLPGYACTAAIFPRRDQSFATLLVFSLAASLILVISLGLLLNLTSMGLRTPSWAIALASVTLLACLIADRRRRPYPYSPVFSGRFRLQAVGFTLDQWLLVSMAIIVLASAFTLSIIGAIQQPRKGFTQLWMLPGSNTPTHSIVRLGVNNLEVGPMHYRLIVNMNGKVMKAWPLLELQSGTQWQSTLSLPLAPRNKTLRLEATLSLENTPNKTYRYVVLWLGSKTPVTVQRSTTPTPTILPLPSSIILSRRK